MANRNLNRTYNVNDSRSPPRAPRRAVNQPDSPRTPPPANVNRTYNVDQNVLNVTYNVSQHDLTLSATSSTMDMTEYTINEHPSWEQQQQIANATYTVDDAYDPEDNNEYPNPNATYSVRDSSDDSHNMTEYTINHDTPIELHVSNDNNVVNITYDVGGGAAGHGGYYPGVNQPDSPLTPPGAYGRRGYRPAINEPDSPGPYYPGVNQPDSPLIPMGRGRGRHPGVNQPDSPLTPPHHGGYYPGLNQPDSPLTPPHHGGYYPGLNQPDSPLTPPQHPLNVTFQIGGGGSPPGVSPGAINRTYNVPNASFDDRTYNISNPSWDDRTYNIPNASWDDRTYNISNPSWDDRTYNIPNASWDDRTFDISRDQPAHSTPEPLNVTFQIDRSGNRTFEISGGSGNTSGSGYASSYGSSPGACPGSSGRTRSLSRSGNGARSLGRTFDAGSSRSSARCRRSMSPGGYSGAFAYQSIANRTYDTVHSFGEEPTNVTVDVGGNQNVTFEIEEPTSIVVSTPETSMNLTRSMNQTRSMNRTRSLSPRYNRSDFPSDCAPGNTSDYSSGSCSRSRSMTPPPDSPKPEVTITVTPNGNENMTVTVEEDSFNPELHSTPNSANCSYQLNETY